MDNNKKRPVWYSILLYLVLFSIAGIIVYFVISGFTSTNNTLSTDDAITKIYEQKNNDSLEDKYIVYASQAVKNSDKVTVTMNVAVKDANTGSYSRKTYKFAVTNDLFTDSSLVTDENYEHANRSMQNALYDETLRANTLIDAGSAVSSIISKSNVLYDNSVYEENWFVSWLPTIIMIAAFVLVGFFFFRMLSSAGGANKQAMDFNKSRARRVDDSKVKFKDVAGCDEEKQEMMELVDYLKNPKKFTTCGAKLPKGVLLVGPPGTGKTLLAKAVAGEAGVPFFSISGSDFVEMFVGVGAGRVRDLFKTAKQNAPCIVFIDEIDAVGRQRGAGMGGGNDEREQTLNQMLVELDGFEENSGIIVLAATNRDDVLDPALLRAGRFDRKITVNLPDQKGREAIFKVHARNKKLDPSIDFVLLAKRTIGFSGADIANILNEAAILAVRGKRETISIADIDEAIDRRIAGPAKSNRSLSEKEKKQIAYHEAGHAIIGLTLPDADKVRKITIIPRGNTGGHVMMTPDNDRFMYTKNELIAEIIGLLGGRSSEEVFFEDVGTGASNDIERATYIARSMVVEYGMSSLGPIQYEKNTGSVFLGRDYTSAQKNFSNKVADEIDAEIRKIIDEAHKEAIRIITERKDDVILIAETLITNETITEEQIGYLLENRKLPEDTVLQKDSASSLNNDENNSKIASDDTIINDK